VWGPYSQDSLWCIHFLSPVFWHFISLKWYFFFQCVYWLDRSSLSIAHGGSVRGVGVWQVFIFQKHTTSEIQAIINILLLILALPTLPFHSWTKYVLMYCQVNLLPAALPIERFGTEEYMCECLCVCARVFAACMWEWAIQIIYRCVTYVCNRCILPSWYSYFMNHIFIFCS
jgi:hypothetical protein